MHVPQRIRIVSTDGADSRVETEDGRLITGVSSVRVTMRPGECAVAHLTVRAPILDVAIGEGRARIRKARP